MQIIKLDAIDSTNRYLKELSRDQLVEDFTVVIADEQRKGKGQMGTEWVVEKGKNLTFSVLKKFERLRPNNRFEISICTSLAIHDSLKGLGIPKLTVKWPNDIMSGTTKIGGILIENRIEGQFITTSIIGIGLNVNQTDYSNLKNAGSLSSVTGNYFDLEEVLKVILEQMQHYFDLQANSKGKFLYEAYEDVLFRKDMASSFKNRRGDLLQGIIRGISQEGKLLVEMDGRLDEFGLKELTLFY